MNTDASTSSSVTPPRVHLLYIIRDYYPTERPDVVVLFGRRLPEEGVTSDLVAIGSPAPAPGWQAGREVVCEARTGSVAASFKGLLTDLRELRRARYDIAVVRDKIFLAVLAATLVGRDRLTYWMSYPFPEDDLVRMKVTTRGRVYQAVLWLRGHLTSWLLYRYVVPRVAHVFVQSDHMARSVIERSGRRDGFTVVPMGVDETMLAAGVEERRLPGPAEPFRLVYLGALDAPRRIDFLVEVVAALRSRPGERDAWQLTLIGSTSPDELKWLQTRIRDLGADDVVRLTGRMPMADAWAICAQCHIGMSAIPRGELFDVSSPTKAVEYLGIGLPVLVNDIPDQQYLVAATGAGLCAPMEVDRFVEAVRQLRDDYPAYARRAMSARDWMVRERGYRSLAARVANVLRDLTRR